MLDLLYIQKYYYYFIAFISFIILISVLSYSRRTSWQAIIKFAVYIFAFFTIYYLGSRDINIGVDTFRYEQNFLEYKYSSSFQISKDPFYDFLSYILSRFFEFSTLLFLCAFIYVFGALYGLRKIFKENYFLPFLVFIISPYFINSGINVMRSGVASSLFLAGLGLYYERGMKWKTASFFILSVLFHISLLVPLFCFILTRFIKNTKVIFIAWLISIVLGILKINVIITLVQNLGLFEARIGSYANNDGDRVFWLNFVIFGFIPVVLGVYNILILKYKDGFYTWLVNAYMLIHIPYIILINSQFGSRLGYLAEFMLPIILLFPLLNNPLIKINYARINLSIIIFIVFMLKAYKVLVI